MQKRDIFISGGTGYVGRPLVTQLLARGHRVRVLARSGSEKKVPAGAEIVPGNALDAATFASTVRPGDTFVQLTGVAHPAPWDEGQFRAIDQKSLEASASAAKAAGVRHFVYVSVAHPAPTMKAYIQVRQECERYLEKTQIPSTVLRPWYVLGPAHRWPAVLKPFYSLFEAIPSKRDSALRLGLVTLDQMVSALVWAVENPSVTTRIIDVPGIRNPPLQVSRVHV